MGGDKYRRRIAEIDQAIAKLDGQRKEYRKAKHMAESSNEQMYYSNSQGDIIIGEIAERWKNDSDIACCAADSAQESKRLISQNHEFFYESETVYREELKKLRWQEEDYLGEKKETQAILKRIEQEKGSFPRGYM